MCPQEEDHRTGFQASSLRYIIFSPYGNNAGGVRYNPDGIMGKQVLYGSSRAGCGAKAFNHRTGEAEASRDL